MRSLQPHNPKVVGSNPTPATNEYKGRLDRRLSMSGRSFISPPVPLWRVLGRLVAPLLT